MRPTGSGFVRKRKLVSFASPTACSNESKTRTVTTGPKMSSRVMQQEGVSPVNTVGGIYAPTLRSASE
jgi:hypothetical protein